MLAHEGISKLGSAKSRSSKKVQFKNKSDDSIEKPAKPPPSKQGKKNGDKPDNPFIRAKTNNFFSDTMPNMHKPKSDSYEKKYFQQMLSKLQRSHSLPENKISRLKTPPKESKKTEHKHQKHEKDSKQKRRRSLFSSGSKKGSISPMWEKRKSLSVDAEKNGNPLEIVGVQSVMASRSSSRCGTPDEFAMNKRISKSRELIQKLSKKIDFVQSSHHDLGPRSSIFDNNNPVNDERLVSSKSLAEISNLVAELDNNLQIWQQDRKGSRRSGYPGSQTPECSSNLEIDVEEIQLPIHNNVAFPDVCNTKPSQYPQLNDLIIDENTLHIYYNDVIGRGTFALVYKGEFIHTNVAVKKFKTALPKSRVSDGIISSAKEATILANLRHPNIVQILGLYPKFQDSSSAVIDCKSELTLVLELLEGGSLRQYLDVIANALDSSTFFNIAIDLAKALVYLHGQKRPIVHLDVKSSNVLLDLTKQHAKLADFGLAQALDDSQCQIYLDGIKGTPAWMAPEIITKKPVTMSADVYSFGLVLWEMLSGLKPYEGLSISEVTCQISQGHHPSLSLEYDMKIPGVNKLIISCWSLVAHFRPNMSTILHKLKVLRKQQENIAGTKFMSMDEIRATSMILEAPVSGVPVNQPDLPQRNEAKNSNIPKLDLTDLTETYEPSVEYLDRVEPNLESPELPKTNEPLPMSPPGFHFRRSISTPMMPFMPEPPPPPPQKVLNESDKQENKSKVKKIFHRSFSVSQEQLVDQKKKLKPVKILDSKFKFMLPSRRDLNSVLKSAVQERRISGWKTEDSSSPSWSEEGI